MPAQPRTGLFCKEHGGTVDIIDKGWACDKCAPIGYSKCSCGGNARGFGEALMSSAGCEDCEEYVVGLDVNSKELWNAGVRGWIPDEFFSKPTAEIVEALLGKNSESKD
jgi:hypothetical protein